MAKILAKIAKSEAFVGSAHSAETIKRKARERSSIRAEHEVPLAEVKICLSARRAPIVLPPALGAMRGPGRAGTPSSSAEWQ